jgi:hypothetical protein
MALGLTEGKVSLSTCGVLQLYMILETPGSVAALKSARAKGSRKYLLHIYFKPEIINRSSSDALCNPLSNAAAGHCFLHGLLLKFN